MGLVFVGVEKQATRKFPMYHLQSKQFTCRGDSSGLVSTEVNEGVTEMMMFVWVDCNRKYFVTIIESLEKGHTFLRHKWCQVNEDVNAEEQMEQLDNHKTLEVDIYYAMCSYIDWNNQRRCDDINLEKKLRTHNWYWRVKMSIFGVSVFDTYNVATQYLAYEENFMHYFVIF